MERAVIVSTARTPIGKAYRGHSMILMLRHWEGMQFIMHLLEQRLVLMKLMIHSWDAADRRVRKEKISLGSVPWLQDCL